MYEMSFLWRFLIGAGTLLTTGAFHLFVVALGAAVIWRVRGALSLRGLRWVGGGLILFGLTGLMGDVTWFVTGLSDLGYKAMGYLGSGPVRLVDLLVMMASYLVDAACLAMIVLGSVAVLWELAPAEAEASEASEESTEAPHDEADVTDPRSLSVVNGD